MPPMIPHPEDAEAGDEMRVLARLRALLPDAKRKRSEVPVPAAGDDILHENLKAYLLMDLYLQQRR